MSVPDGLIVTYFEHCTRLPMEQVETYAKELKAGKTNPRDIKMALASELVKMYAGEAAAKEAQDYFVNVFQKKTTPDEMPTAKVAGMTIVDALVESKIATSKTKARQLVEQGAVKIDEEVVKSIEQKVKTGNKIQKGKRFFVRVG